MRIAHERWQRASVNENGFGWPMVPIHMFLLRKSTNSRNTNTLFNESVGLLLCHQFAYTTHTCTKKRRKIETNYH